MRVVFGLLLELVLRTDLNDRQRNKRQLSEMKKSSHSTEEITAEFARLLLSHLLSLVPFKDFKNQ